MGSDTYELIIMFLSMIILLLIMMIFYNDDYNIDEYNSYGEYMYNKALCLDKGGEIVIKDNLKHCFKDGNFILIDKSFMYE